MTKYRWSFKVKGRTAFPLDMLRYDSCYPATQQGVVELSDSLSAEGRRMNEPGVFTVDMICHHSPPEAGRWSSFGWSVTDVKRQS